MRHIFKISAALLLVGAACLLQSGCKRQEGDPQAIYPEKISDRLILKAVGSPEKDRHVHYLDRFTKKDADIDFYDGQFAHVEYRPDGSLSEVLVYYPLADNQTTSARKMERHILIDKDGQTFLSDILQTKEGTLVRSGKLTAPGAYEVQFYAPDGSRIIRHQLFNLIMTADNKPRGWNLTAEDILRPDGSIGSQIGVLVDGTNWVKTFSNKGVLLTEVDTDPHGANVATTYFDADGKTPRFKTVQAEFSVSVITYDHGIVALERDYGYDWGMTVIVYEKGVAKFKQDWSVAATTTGADGKDHYSYRLSSVEELDAAGNTTRMIDFAHDGKTIDKVVILGKGNTSIWFGERTVKEFYPDGAISEVDKYDQNSNSISKEAHTEKENVREPMAPELTQAHPYDAPLPDRITPKTPTQEGYDGED